jgi:group I intron endonuclease
MQTSIQLSYGVIYKVTNNFNGKCYIGQTTDYKRRLRKYRLLHCKGQPKLYNALKKYGISNFTFDIITSTPTMKQLDILEKLYIALLDTIKTGYNCDRGGRGVKLFKPKNCIIKTHINKHGNKGRIPWNKG